MESDDKSSEPPERSPRGEASAAPVAGVHPVKAETAAAAGRRASVEVCDPRRRLLPEARAWMAELTGRAAELLGTRGEVRVRLVIDEEMAEAHQRHRNVPGTTDVLTFDLSEGAESGELDVDILVCVDEAARQSKQRGHPIERELLLYVIHGVLHCVGYDDHDEVGASRMHAKEDELLSALGVGVVYAAPEVVS